MLGESFSRLADVNKENISQTIDEIKKEIKLLQYSGVPSDEIAYAKGHFIGSLQAEIANLFAVAEKVKALKLFSLQGTYYQDMITSITQLSPDDLQELATTHLDVDTFFEVIVG